MPDDKQPDDVLTPDPDPAPPPRAQRSQRPRDDDDYDDRDRRDDEYHPRGRKVKYDEDGDEITSEHTTWAMMSHLGVAVVWFLAGILAFLPPLVIWLSFPRSAFVIRHAKEALNHFISYVMWMFLTAGVAVAIGFAVYGLAQSVPAGLITGYALFLIPYLVLNIVALVFTIKASIAASKGEEYRYRFTVRLIG